MQDPQEWRPDVRLRTLTLVGESVIQLPSSLWASHPAGMGLLISYNRHSYHLDVASSLSSGVGLPFESFQSIWLKVIQHLVVILLFL